MHNWKIIVETDQRTIEFVLAAHTYSDAYIAASKQYPGGTLKSIKRVEPAEQAPDVEE